MVHSGVNSLLQRERAEGSQVVVSESPADNTTTEEPSYVLNQTDTKCACLSSVAMNRRLWIDKQAILKTAIPFSLEGRKGHTHKGHGEKALKIINLRVFLGCFQRASGSFRVFSGCFQVVFRIFFPMAPFRVCALDASKFSVPPPPWRRWVVIRISDSESKFSVLLI